MTRKEDLAYLAGFLDGEGHVTIQRRRHNDTSHVSHDHAAKILITNTSKGVLEWIQNKFGGSLTSPPSFQKRGKGRKQVWVLCFSKKADLEKVLEGTLPFLKVKQKQASLALEFMRFKKPNAVRYYGFRYGTSALAEAELSKRDQYYWSMKALNHRGLIQAPELHAKLAEKLNGLV